MRWPSFRFSLAQLTLLLALAAILVAAGMLWWQPPGVWKAYVSDIAFSTDGQRLAASVSRYRRVEGAETTSKFAVTDISETFFLFDAIDLGREKLLARTSGNWTYYPNGLRLICGRSLAFSPDGTQLATQETGDGVSFWHIPSGVRARQLCPGNGGAGGICWANDGTLLAGDDCGGFVLRPHAPEFKKQIPAPAMESALISANGGKAVTAFFGGGLLLWDVGPVEST